MSAAGKKVLGFVAVSGGLEVSAAMEMEWKPARPSDANLFKNIFKCTIFSGKKITNCMHCL
jgi:hypothetical protein